jgi:hypothetical protein
MMYCQNDNGVKYPLKIVSTDMSLAINGIYHDLKIIRIMLNRMWQGKETMY